MQTDKETDRQHWVFTKVIAIHMSFPRLMQKDSGILYIIILYGCYMNWGKLKSMHESVQYNTITCSDSIICCKVRQGWKWTWVAVSIVHSSIFWFVSFTILYKINIAWLGHIYFLILMTIIKTRHKPWHQSARYQSAMTVIMLQW